MTDTKYFKKVEAAAREYAAEVRLDAQQGGFGDHEARDLEAQIEAWVAGLEQKIPPVLQEIADKVNRDRILTY